MLGDFNIDLLRYSDQEVSLFLDLLGSNLILPHVLLPTRVTSNTKTLIDNIFTTIDGSTCVSGNLVHVISDHLPQFLLSYSPDSSSSVGENTATYPDWSKFDQPNFILDFLNINWPETLRLEESNINSSFDAFDTIISKLVDQHLPTRRLTKKQMYTNQKPWITPAIIKSMSKRDFFFRKFCNAKSPLSKSNFHAQFKVYRNLIVSLCRRSKLNHYTRYFDYHSANMQKIWQGVKQLISVKSSSSINTSPASLNINGKISSDPLSIANCFNQYFSSVANSVRTKIPPATKHFSSYLNNPNPNSIFLTPCSPLEIQKLISSFPIKKSSGPHSIPIRILKLISNDISVPLSDIINLSFETGKFPDILKISKVIPIFKKGSPLEPSNYRPISLLSNIEKIFEKLMYSRISNFLDRHQILYFRQYGFRKSHSTTQAIINIIERIRQSLDNGQLACGVFVDLQKAFDTVDHEILCSKLNHYGIRGVANSWFKSYLSSRLQFVSIANSKSELRLMEYGVPQGSVLGPLLFLIYINDLHVPIKFGDIYHFADDTNLLHFDTNMKSLSKKVNANLKFLCKWLSANKIALNRDKTELIIFRHKSKRLETPKIKINGKRLTPSPFIKYLGVYIDEHLTWHKQVSELSLKLRRANGALSKIRHFVPLNTLLNIYHALFNSHLIYACQAWGQCETSITKRTFILQKSAMRLMSFSPFQSPSSPLFSLFRIPKIFDLVHIANILFIHQFFNSALPADILSTFKFSKLVHTYNTRGNSLSLLNLPSVNTTSFGLGSLSKRAINQWNSFQRLNPNTNLSSLPYSKLKSMISSHILNSYVVPD